MELYTKKDVRNIPEEIELKSSQYYVLTLKDDDVYFDGYAEVYDATITIHNSDDTHDANQQKEFDVTITHEAYCYEVHGE